MKICDPSLGLRIRLNHPSIQPDPYPFYARLREAAPLVRCRQHFVGKAWAVTRHREVSRVLEDTERFASNPTTVTGRPGPLESRVAPRLIRAFGRSMIFSDGVDHRRLRGLISKAFTPARVDDLRERVQRIVDELLDDAEREGTLDLVTRVALPLPLRVVCELLGIREGQREFRRTIQSTLDVRSAWGFAARLPSFGRLHRYFEQLIEHKRSDPADDLTRALITAEARGDRLSSDEVIGMLFLLLLAGHETTMNLLGNGTLALIDHPEQLERLRAEPSRIPAAVEEMLRFYSPLHFTATRYVTERCELGGVELTRGERVVPLLAAANRDPSVFEAPDTFDVGRAPNRHVAFGGGRHFCVGAHLARVEAQLLFARIIARFPGLRLAVARSQIRWRKDGSGLRGLQALPVCVG